MLQSLSPRQEGDPLQGTRVGILRLGAEALPTFVPSSRQETEISVHADLWMQFKADKESAKK